YEFRDFPVHDVLDIGPILLGHCVEPALFFPMLDQMMKNQDTLLGNMDKKLTPADQAALQGKSPNEVATTLAEKIGYLDFVKQRGVPEAKARACLADKGALEALAKNLQTANTKYQISQTPTFILNGAKLDTVDTWDKLEPALKNAGA
ncbi:MAG: DsbA family protein, partial [Sphingomonas sp.]